MPYKFLPSVLWYVRNIFDKETAKRLKSLQEETFETAKRKDLILEVGQKITLTFTLRNALEIAELVKWFEELKKKNKPIPLKNTGLNLTIKDVYIKINDTNKNLEVVVEGEFVM